MGGKKGDTFVTWLIDVFLSMPHMMFLILISVAVGKGLQGVIIGLALTHWTGLTRLIRAEIKQIKTENFISISKALGKSPMWIAVKHIFPHLISQVFVAMILLFPHAILHEAGISFLGFGLSLSSPAIGIILSESMKYLAQGYWWLAFFPELILELDILRRTNDGIQETWQYQQLLSLPCRSIASAVPLGAATGWAPSAPAAGPRVGHAAR